jgi:hypothetical protein
MGLLQERIAGQAIPHLKRCVEATPGDSTCQYHLGMAYIAAKNPARRESTWNWP